MPFFFSPAPDPSASLPVDAPPKRPPRAEADGAGAEPPKRPPPVAAAKMEGGDADPEAAAPKSPLEAVDDEDGAEAKPLKKEAPEAPKACELAAGAELKRAVAWVWPVRMHHHL